MAALKSFLSKRLFSSSSIACKPLLKSRALEMLTYYPPDINMLNFANQDSDIRKLGLKDVWLENKVAKENFLKAREKKIFVPVMGGRKSPAENKSDSDGKKKKKKRR
ncbi:hypothetical protein HK098_003980 [Nowakowskiella sp. JEL0407]|nr:hypothetical protein HK098_003980 [Nowakowskiella sp. JEL0407]